MGGILATVIQYVPKPFSWGVTSLGFAVEEFAGF